MFAWLHQLMLSYFDPHYNEYHRITALNNPCNSLEHWHFKMFKPEVVTGWTVSGRKNKVESYIKIWCALVILQIILIIFNTYAAVL